MPNEYARIDSDQKESDYARVESDQTPNEYANQKWKICESNK